MAICGQALSAPTSRCPSAPKPSTFLGRRDVGAKESSSGLSSHSTTITRVTVRVLPAVPSVLAPPMQNGPLTVQPGVAVKEVSRADFPADFSFGAGISAFQVEGHPFAGGRGSTIWDSFQSIPGKIVDGTLNYPGCDFYNRYEDDIKLAKQMGLTSFRLSISWTRIYPNGGQPGKPESIEGV